MPQVSFPGLDGSTRALVTAGAGGIGRVIARQLLVCGARVHVCDIDAAAIDDLLTEHPTMTATRADVSSTLQVERVFEDARREMGGLDTLVNNVGISGPTAAVEDIEPADWDRTVAVDLNAPFYCTRLAVPLLKAAGGGSIINIASNAAFFGCALRAPYTACKWAMLGFTRTLAVELGPPRHPGQCDLPWQRLGTAYRCCHRTRCRGERHLSRESPRLVSAPELDAQIRRCGRDRRGRSIPVLGPRSVHFRPGDRR